MINSKQRAYLRSLANTLKATEQVGKGGVSDSLIHQLSESLENHELIKVSILETSLMSGRECGRILADTLDAELVQVIGSRVTLYRQASEPDSRRIVLP